MDLNKVLQIAREPVDEWIIQARKDTTELEMHYYGDKKQLEEYLQKVDGLESDEKLELRRRYAISNRFLCENILSPLNNIFSARGTTIDIDIASESTKKAFLNILKDVKGGYSHQEYMKQVWKDKFIADPAGLMFLESTRDGSKAYITQKSIHGIRKMKLYGIIPEYVMFEADVQVHDTRTDEEIAKEKDGKRRGYKLHWFVTPEKYYRLKIWDDPERPIEEISEDSIVNKMGIVPGITNSTLRDTKRDIPVSPIWKVVELLGKYVRNGSVKEITIAKHGFPIAWAYSNITEGCNSCGGRGFFDDDAQAQRLQRKCSKCGGEGVVYKKDVTDMLILKAPTNKDQPTLSKIAGYEAPPIDSWREQRTEQDWTWNLLHFSLWGTTVEKGANETATGRFIDTQPVINRLNDLQDIREIVQRKMITLFGRYYMSLSFGGADVNGSRRFILETKDQIWEKYLKAKKEGASERNLTQLLEQYYEAEYQTNDMMREYYMKILMIDPLPHNTLSEIGSLSVPQRYKDRKVYLDAYLDTQMINKIVDMPLDKILSELDQFILTKQNEYGQQGSSQDQEEIGEPGQ